MTQKSTDLRKKLEKLGIEVIETDPNAPTRVMVGGRPIRPQGEKQDPRPRAPKQ